MTRFWPVARDMIEIFLAAFWPRYYDRLLARSASSWVIRKMTMRERRVRVEFVRRAVGEGYRRLDLGSIDGSHL